MTKNSTCLAEARRRRVLYIITKSVWGGAAKYVYDLSTNLMSGFDVAIAAGLPRSKAGGQGQFYKEVKKTNIPYYQITNFQRTINPFKDLFAFFEILSLLFQLKPDIIHVNSSKAGGIVGLAGLIYKVFYNKEIKLVFTAHGWAFNEDRPQWQISLIKFFSKVTSLFYDKIICVSEYDRQMALKYKIAPERKLITIHNGIDIKNINFLSKEQAQKKLIGRESPLLIGTIAEWTKNKGLIYLIKATQILELKEKEFDVILIGSGENPDKEKMYDYDKKYNLDNVRLIEFMPEAIKYLKGFNIFILPSLKEGLPYTIIEAMAAQLPIIATNVGGIPEMIENNINGILIEPKNPDLIGEKITYLINNPEKAQVMAQKARQKAEQKFSLNKMIEKTKKLY
ncbi:MAG: glycosyltransferase family 4 protein [Patescibacteria group bacterium]|nr:glycosyltransferase family 4 protein [Patescibacteria group bacterium]